MNKKIEPHIPDDCPIVDVNIHTIKDILLQIIPDKKQIEYIMHYLKEHREIKTSPDIRRNYRNKSMSFS